MPADELTPEEIRSIRAGLGLTLAQLADRLGLSIRAVQHWEGGTRKPSGTARKLLRSLAGRKPARGPRTP